MQRIRTWSAALVVLALTVLVMACDSGSGTGTTPQSDTFTLTVTLQGLGVGTVSNDATGIACDTTGATCSADIPEGTEVTLTATPAAGSEFVGWGSDGTANPLTFTMNADKDVTAEFDNPALAMETVGAAGGTVMSRDSNVTLNIPAGALSGDEDITIEIVDPADLGAEWAELRDSSDIAAAYQMGPDGLQFDSAVTVSLAPSNVILNGDTAEFTMRPLATTGDTGVAELDSLGVSGDLSTGQASVSALLTHFSPLVETSGDVTFKVSGVPESAPVGTSFTASVDIEYPDSWDPQVVDALVGSEGATPGDYNVIDGPDPTHVEFPFTCEIAGTEGRILIRIWVVDQWTNKERRVDLVMVVDCPGYALTVTTSGDGSGTVTGPNASGGSGGISCGSQGSNCSEDFGPDSPVTLTATPDEGSVFAGWTIDGQPATGNGDGTIDVTMDGDHTVDAAFDPAPEEELSVSMGGAGDGTVTSDPAGIDCTKTGDAVTGTCSAMFPHGSTVKLTATDPDGSTISDWSGDGTTDPFGVRYFELLTTALVEIFFPQVPPTVTTLDLASLNVQYLEAMTLVNAAFPFVQPTGDIAKMTTGEACPKVMVAGDGAAMAIDACTGELVQQYDFSAFSFYDAWTIPGPDSVANSSAIFASGQNYAIFWVDDTGAVTDQIGQTGWGTALDATPINGDPKNGLAVTVNSTGPILYFVRYDPSVGYIRVLDNYFGVTTTPPSMQSAYTAGVPDDPAGQPEEAIAVGHTYSTGQLWYMESISDQYPVGSYVADLPGDDPRRIRCDLDTGICAVTDFSNSLVTIVLWSGTGNPTVAENTTAGQVASGPVGLDVYGHFIVTAGYNDDQYSIIEVDDTGAILNVTTQALPAGCSAPGHAKFLRDGANTILISCNASQAIVRIPNAF